MASNELLIKINGDARAAKKAFDDVIAKTEDLQDVLNKASLAAAAAFAVLSGEVFLSVRAFAESERASNELSAALQSQGIFTAELKQSYIDIAQELSRKNGVDDDQIVKAQALAQSYLGQVAITKDLTQVIVDLGAKLGSVETAAALVGKSIGTSTNALARYGVEFRQGATTAEKMQTVIRKLSVQVGGLSEAQIKGLGILGVVRIAFDDLQKKLGEKFAPTVITVSKLLIKLFDAAADSPTLVKLAAAFITVAGATTAIIAAAGPLIGGITAIQGAVAAAGVAGISLGTVLGGIPLVIGATVASIYFLATNWERIFIRMQAAAAAFGAFMNSFFTSLRDAVNAAARADFGDAAKTAFTATINAAKAGYDKYNQVVAEGEKKLADTKKAEQEKQNKEKADAAAKEAAEKKRHDNILAQIQSASDALKLLQLRKASQDEIALKQQELQILKDLENEKNKNVIAAANTRIAELRAQKDQQHVEDLERKKQFEIEKQQVIEELQAEGISGLNSPLAQAQLQALRDQKQLEVDIERQIAAEKLKAQIDADNQFLLNKKKFGATSAALSKILASEEVGAAKDLTGELAALAQSRNSTLKAIGKAAAISQIAISTAEAAVKIFNDSVILFGPIAGPPIGAALAGARIAFGAEQTANVTAAAKGALVGGSGNGDTQPFMLEPGELVAPKRNFSEVVSGVQTERSGIIDEVRDRLSTLESNGGGGVTVQINGDFYGDESFIDKLTANISDAIQFRNQRFVGVNA